MYSILDVMYSIPALGNSIPLRHPLRGLSHRGLPWQVVISVLQESDEAFRRRSKFSAARLELFECRRWGDGHPEMWHECITIAGESS